MREREFAAAGSAKMNSSCSHLLDTIGAYRKSAYIYIYYMYVYMYIYIYAHKYHFQTCFRFALPFNTGPSWPGYSPALRPLRSSVQGNHERQLGWQRPWGLGTPFWLFNSGKSMNIANFFEDLLWKSTWDGWIPKKKSGINHRFLMKRWFFSALKASWLGPSQVSPWRWRCSVLTWLNLKPWNFQLGVLHGRS